MIPDEPLRVTRQCPLAIVVSGLSSDAHTWNLVYVQLVLEELGHHVTNIGPCVPDRELIAYCRAAEPDLIVLGGVNGHGFADGMRVIGGLREAPELAATPVVIGGKLDTVGGAPGAAGRLRAAGFDAVFAEGAGVSGAETLSAFCSFVGSVASGALRASGTLRAAGALSAAGA